MLYDKKRWEPKVPAKPGYRQVLLEAADIIRERGWCQEYEIDDDGHVCVLGALSLTTGSKWTIQKAKKALAEELGGTHDYPPNYTISTWNDDLLFFGEWRAIRLLERVAKK